MGGTKRSSSAKPPIARRVKDRTFYRVGDAWVDSRVTAALRKSARKIAAYSDDYFALLEQHGDLAAFLALGEHVWVVLAGKAIEVVAPSRNAAPGTPDKGNTSPKKPGTRGVERAATPVDRSKR